MLPKQAIHFLPPTPLLHLTSLEELIRVFVEALLQQACSGFLREIIKT